MTALQRVRKCRATVSSSLSITTYVPFAALRHVFQFLIGPMFVLWRSTVSLRSFNCSRIVGVSSDEALSETTTSNEENVCERAEATQSLNHFSRLNVGIAIVKRGLSERSGDVGAISSQW